MSVVDRARSALERSRFGSSARPVVVAVSGGADSLCLLDVMVKLVADRATQLVVGHVDHRLRPDSAADGEHVKDAAVTYGVRCETVVVDVPALARDNGLGIEEAARIGRYRALSGLAGRIGALTILTGHTRSDSIETVLLHLLRGSGQRGLAGLAPAEPLPASLNDAGFVGTSRRLIRILRPLLDVDRAETVAYCLARGIVWRDDPSNADSRFLRNRVRQHLLPVLQTYNPAIDVAIERLARTVSEDEAWLKAVVQRRFRQISMEHEGTVAFELVAWRRLHVAARRRFVRRVAEQYGVVDLGFDAVERALAVGVDGGPGRAELPGRLVVERVGGRLVFSHATLPGRGDQTGRGGST